MNVNGLFHDKVSIDKTVECGVPMRRVTGNVNNAISDVGHSLVDVGHNWTPCFSKLTPLWYPSIHSAVRKGGGLDVGYHIVIIGTKSKRGIDVFFTFLVDNRKKTTSRIAVVARW